MTDVTATMPSATSPQPARSQLARADAMGSRLSGDGGSGMRPFIPHPSAPGGLSTTGCPARDRVTRDRLTPAAFDAIMTTSAITDPTHELGLGNSSAIEYLDGSNLEH